jgi:hypothetical protein
VSNVAALEPWKDKRELADHLGCSPRWISYRAAEGMPHSIIAGRVKYKVSLVEPWLEARGLITHKGDQGEAA